MYIIYISKLNKILKICKNKVQIHLKFINKTHKLYLYIILKANNQLTQ